MCVKGGQDSLTLDCIRKCTHDSRRRFSSLTSLVKQRILVTLQEPQCSSLHPGSQGTTAAPSRVSVRLKPEPFQVYPGWYKSVRLGGRGRERNPTRGLNSALFPGFAAVLAPPLLPKVRWTGKTKRAKLKIAL